MSAARHDVAKLIRRRSGLLVTGEAGPRTLEWTNTPAPGGHGTPNDLERLRQQLAADLEVLATATARLAVIGSALGPVVPGSRPAGEPADVGC